MLSRRVLGLTLLVASGCGYGIEPDRTQTESPEVNVAFGWSRPVTRDNFDPVVANRLGKAASAVDGHTLRQIVTDPTVRVRGDDQACVTCHPWVANVPRRVFCEHVLDFMAMPTAKGDGTDPKNAKPLLFKELLARWRDAGCPD